MTDQYHVPVLKNEVLQYLVTDTKGVYLDGTTGGGGHANHLLEHLDKMAVYIGLDQDVEAIEFAQKRLQKFPNVKLYHANFTDMYQIMKKAGFDSVDGVLLDLGLSSHQIAKRARGFSFMQDAPLDMRMDQQSSLTAEEILNHTEEEALAKIFFKYGEEKKSRQIARKIVEFRKKQALRTTGQLRTIVEKCVGQKQSVKSCARIFQALRIITNREIERLIEGLNSAFRCLQTSGRLVVLSYHSLEDREVKNFIKSKAKPCSCPPELPVCICDKKPQMKILTRKAVKAGDAEIARNARARSSRLRAGEKL